MHRDLINKLIKSSNKKLVLCNKNIAFYKKIIKMKATMSFIKDHIVNNLNKL